MSSDTVANLSAHLTLYRDRGPDIHFFTIVQKPFA